MFQLNFSKKLINCPVFPDEVLHPFVPSTVAAKEAIEQVENVDTSPMHSHEEHSEEELVFQPTPSAQKPKPISTSKKGKEKLPEFMEHIFEDEAIPSPPPHKKAKRTTSSKKGQTKMSAVYISHFYSSSFEDEPAVPAPQKRKSQSLMPESPSAMDAAPSDREGSDVAITREV